MGLYAFSPPNVTRVEDEIEFRSLWIVPFALGEVISDEVLDSGRRRLMITGRRVKSVKNTNLAIKVGSLKSDVKLSPPAPA